jgi:hypothetical protein
MAFLSTTSKQLAKSMLESGYQYGTPVRLISCHIGVAGDGAAYQLSRYLRAPVTASTREVSVMQGGKYIINEGGRWRTFFNKTIR